MAESEPTSDDEGKTINLIDFNSFLGDQPSATKHYPASVRRTGKCILDETLMEEHQPQQNNDLSNVTLTPDLQQDKSAMSVSRLSTISKQMFTGDVTFYDKMSNDRQQDIKTLCASNEETPREKTMVEELRHRTDELIATRRVMHQLANDFEDYRTFHDAEYRVWDEERQELLGKCNSLEKLINQQSAALTVLTTERDDANSQCEKLFLEVYKLNKLTGKLERVEMAKECLQEQYDALMRAYEDLQQNNQCNVPALVESDDLVTQLKEELESYKQAVVTLQAKLTSTEEELSDFRSASKEQMAEAEKIFNEKNDEIKSLEDKVKTAEKRLHMFKESANKAEAYNVERLRHVTDQLQSSVTQCQTLRHQLAAEDLRSERLEERIVRLEKICDEADASEAEYKNTIANLSKRIKELEMGRGDGCFN